MKPMGSSLLEGCQAALLEVGLEVDLLLLLLLLLAEHLLLLLDSLVETIVLAVARLAQMQPEVPKMLEGRHSMPVKSLSVMWIRHSWLCRLQH